MRYRLQRHDGTDCSATMVPITVLRMVPIQRYRQFNHYDKFNLIISEFSLFNQILIMNKTNSTNIMINSSLKIRQA